MKGRADTDRVSDSCVPSPVGTASRADAYDALGWRQPAVRRHWLLSGDELAAEVECQRVEWAVKMAVIESEVR